MEEQTYQVASYWEESSILQKHLLNDRFLKNAHDNLNLLEKQIQRCEVEIDHLEPKVQNSPKYLKRFEDAKQILCEIRQEHINIKIKLVYILIEENKYRPSRMIDMLVSADRAADMQANLAEVFPLWVERHGLTAAHRIHKVQIARLIIGEYWNKAIELIKAVKFAGS